MISPERIDALQRQWVSLLGSYEVSASAAYPVFDELVTAYTEPHRHYHTLEHVADVLRVVGRLSRRCDDVRSVQFAAWFHDVVYDVKSHSNEESSSEWANVRLTALGLPREVALHVSDLVRVTTHAPCNVLQPTDAAIILDADLAILGASEARYLRYAADIRKEYDHVSDTDYRAGRAKILELFLARECIYLTDVMFAEGEAAARNNLMRELTALSQSSNDRRILPPSSTL